jgi:putative acyl-CoA dehydrogenase
MRCCAKARARSPTTSPPYARLAGDTLYTLSFDAHRDRPRLRTHDRFGARIDRVEFHPNYHAILRAAIENGVAGLSWRDPSPGAHVARAALSYLHHQVEPGTSCPLTMTHAAVPALAHAPTLREWREKAAAPHYDPRELPIADKRGVTLGMGMTEKQGGSDVRANTTRAARLAGEGEYALTGHKWFFSAPMSDGFLVLAQAPGGLTCFLLPRRLPDGARNAFTLMRLKDKLGDWSNASSEVEFQGAWAQRVGEEGRGVATILEMVMLTRLDCMLGSAAEMRMALAQAMHHTRYRRAFGKVLAGQPLMRNVLADLAIESEAALALSMRVARAVDAAPRVPSEAAFARIATAIGKYWICKRAPAFRQRGAGMPRRRGLRGGIAVAAFVSASAAQLDLGRQREHPVPRRAARAAARAGRARTRSSRSCRTGCMRRSTSKWRGCAMRCARRTKGARGISSSGWRSRCRRRCCWPRGIRWPKRSA